MEKGFWESGLGWVGHIQDLTSDLQFLMKGRAWIVFNLCNLSECKWRKTECSYFNLKFDLFLTLTTWQRLFHNVNYSPKVIMWTVCQRPLTSLKVVAAFDELGAGTRGLKWTVSFKHFVWRLNMFWKKQRDTALQLFVAQKTEVLFLLYCTKISDSTFQCRKLHSSVQVVLLFIAHCLFYDLDVLTTKPIKRVDSHFFKSVSKQ